MPRVRPNGAERWANRTAAATGDYQAGVATPRQSWQQATVAAADAHKAATTQALAEGRFARGVSKAGDEKWRRNAQGKGAERFGPGAAAGVQDYRDGVAPFLQVIESTPLPPRGPKGDPRNIQRVAALATALHKKKVGGFAGMAALVLGLVVSVVVAAGACAWVLTEDTSLRRGLSRNAGAGNGGSVKTRCAVLPAVLAGLLPFLVVGAALDTVSASATAAVAGGTAMAAVAGDSLAIRNTPIDVEPVILTCWAKKQTAGFTQITHPSGQDQVRDIRMRDSVAAPLPLFAGGFGEPVTPQELLSLTTSGAAVAGDIELAHMLIYYPTLPGIDAKLIDLGTLESRFVELVTIEDTTTATAGAAYSGARALNAASDLLAANTEFAILGAQIGVTCGALTVRGVDTGNLRFAIPGIAARPDITGTWFVWLVEQFGLPLIPVINSANKAGIFIENVQDENLAAVPFSLMLARLSQ